MLHLLSKETEACERPDKSIPIETCNMQTLESTRIWASKIDPRYNNIFEVDRTDAGRIDLMCLKVIARGKYKKGKYSQRFDINF
nr:unnamed protein product [Callosobruchus analis]